jgi:hypothetical protein
MLTRVIRKGLNVRVCSQCKELKDSSCFNKRKQTKLHSECKVCSAARYKKWREANLEQQRIKDRVIHYKRAYNLSEQEAVKLVENRTDCCQICKELKPLVVDHCHTTGLVRGLVCSACNSVLGYAKDKTDTLNNAINYLRNFNEKLLQTG